MRRIGALMLLPAVCFMAGCMMGPDYVKPEVEIPATFIYQEKEITGAVNTAWWKQFHDPLLESLIADALANNKNIQMAAANVEKAEAVLMQIRSPLFPQFGYGGGGARQRISESAMAGSPKNPYNSYQAASSASWEPDLWGRIRRLSEAGRADLVATEEARRGILLSLVSSTASTYLQLVGLDEQLAISKRSLAAYDESVRLFENQFAFGQVSQMTVEQARTQYETAAATIPQIEQHIIQMENALSILLGRNPGPVVRGRTLDEMMMPEVPSGLPSDVIAGRPDIRQAEQNLIALNARIGAAKALYFPSISLTGDFGYASADLSDLFDGRSRLWNYSGSVTGPIFTGGAIYAQVKQAEAARKAALLNYQLSIQNAFADVENALIARRKLAEKVEAESRLVRAGKEYARLSRLQYDGGYAPYATVLQAQQQLFPAELTYAQSRASLLSAMVDIYKAMGGGWIMEADLMTRQAPVD